MMQEAILKLGLTNEEFRLASEASYAKAQVNKMVIDYLNLQAQMNAIVHKRSEIKAETTHNRLMNSVVTVQIEDTKQPNDNTSNLSVLKSPVPEERL